MEWQHDVSEAKDPLSANFCMLNEISKLNDHFENETLSKIPKMVVQAPDFDFYHSSRNVNDTPLFQNNPTLKVNPQPLASLSDSDESFELINDADVTSAVETKACHNPQNSTTKPLDRTDENNHSWTANASTSDVNFPYPNNYTDNESYEWLDEPLFVEVENQNLPNLQNVSPNFTSKLESHLDNPANVSMLEKKRTSSDSDESFELIDWSPEKVFDLKESRQLYFPHNVSSNSTSNVRDFHNTVVKKESSTAKIFTNEEMNPLRSPDIFARPEIPEASCHHSLLSTHLSFDTEFNLDPEKERLVSSTKEPTDVDGSFEKLYEELENMLSVNETASCHKALPSASISFDIEYNHDTTEGQRALSSTTNGNEKPENTLMPSHLNFDIKSDSQLTPNLEVPISKVSTDEDESFKKLDNIVSVAQTMCNEVQKFPYLSFDKTSNTENLAKENAASFHYFNPLLVTNSANRDESLDSPVSSESITSMTEVTYLEAQMSACLISNTGSVDNVKEKAHSLPPDVFTHLNSSVDCAKYGDKVSEGLSNEAPQSLIFVSENEISSNMASLNLNSDLLSINGTAKGNNSSPLRVSISDEIPNVYDKTLTATTSTISPPLSMEKKVELSIKGTSADDSVKVVSEKLKKCSIETQLDGHFSPNKRIGKEERDFMNVLNERHVPKHKKIHTKGNRTCAEHHGQVIEIVQGGDKDKVGEEETPSVPPIFSRPKIPDNVSVLRSNCLSYLNKLNQSNRGNRSTLGCSDHCRTEENGIIIGWRRRDSSRHKLKRKLTEPEWDKEKEDIDSFGGFYIES